MGNPSDIDTAGFVIAKKVRLELEVEAVGDVLARE